MSVNILASVVIVVVALEYDSHVSLARRLGEVVVHATVEGALLDVLRRVCTHAAYFGPHKVRVGLGLNLGEDLEQFAHYSHPVHDGHLVV